MSNLPDGEVTTLTPRGSRPVQWLTRTDTNDGALVMGIMALDEYGLGRLRRLNGNVVDIGAHIGTVAIALAVDHPNIRIIAVEAVPENVEILRINIAHNGLGDRIKVIEAAACEPGRKSVKLQWNYSAAPNVDEAYIKDSRYIANMLEAEDSVSETHKVPGIDLDTIVEITGGAIELLKIDCEGCEWQFLKSPALAKVNIIIGEYHNKGGLASLQKLIAKTHTVEQTGGGDDIGMFMAVRR